MLKKSILAIGMIALTAPALSVELSDFAPKSSTLDLQVGTFNEVKTFGGGLTIEPMENLFLKGEFKSLDRDGNMSKVSLDYKRDIKDNLRGVTGVSLFSMDNDIMEQDAKTFKFGFEYDLDAEVQLEIGAERFFNEDMADTTNMYYGLSYEMEKGVRIAFIHSEAYNNTSLNFSFPIK
jgi:hypothetical protein